MPDRPLEAMATGLPIISTDVGCMDMLLAGGRGGGLFNVGDHAGMADYAARLAADPALRTKTGAQARAVIVEMLCPDVILPQIEAVYRKVTPAA